MNFLDNYALHAGGNECPQLFHKWSGLSALSSLIGKRVYTYQGDFNVYTNMYVVLVGNPGIKKSTAMKIARRLVGDVRDNAQTPYVPIAPISITKEALTQLMGDKKSPCRKTFELGDEKRQFTQMSVYANELITLLSAGGNPAGMIDFFTDVWDEDGMAEIKTKGAGTDRIWNPYITLLGCMTPQKMRQMMFDKIISGGFTRRCMFIWGGHNEKPVPRLFKTKAQDDARERCIDYAQRLQDVSGIFQWTPEAESFYDNWYRENFYRCENCHDDVVFQEYLRSKGEYVIKLGMLMALSKSFELILTPECLEDAVQTMNEIEPGYRSIFAGAGSNDLGQVQSHVEAMLLDAKEPIKKKVFFHSFRKEATFDQLESIIKHLEAADILEQRKIKVNGTWIDMIATPGQIDEYLKEQA